jgi:hypothetical protein
VTTVITTMMAACRGSSMRANATQPGVIMPPGERLVVR